MTSVETLKSIKIISYQLLSEIDPLMFFKGDGERIYKDRELPGGILEIKIDVLQVYREIVQRENDEETWDWAHLMISAQYIAKNSEEVLIEFDEGFLVRSDGMVPLDWEQLKDILRFPQNSSI